MTQEIPRPLLAVTAAKENTCVGAFVDTVQSQIPISVVTNSLSPA